MLRTWHHWIPMLVKRGLVIKSKFVWTTICSTPRVEPPWPAIMRDHQRNGPFVWNKISKPAIVLWTGWWIPWANQTIDVGFLCIRTAIHYKPLFCYVEPVRSRNVDRYVNFLTNLNNEIEIFRDSIRVGWELFSEIDVQMQRSVVQAERGFELTTNSKDDGKTIDDAGSGQRRQSFSRSERLIFFHTENGERMLRPIVLFWRHHMLRSAVDIKFTRLKLNKCEFAIGSCDGIATCFWLKSQMCGEDVMNWLLRPNQVDRALFFFSMCLGFECWEPTLRSLKGIMPFFEERRV